jgi:hypothetical protein
LALNSDFGARNSEFQGKISEGFSLSQKREQRPGVRVIEHPARAISRLQFGSSFGGTRRHA